MDKDGWMDGDDGWMQRCRDGYGWMDGCRKWMMHAGMDGCMTGWMDRGLTA